MSEATDILIDYIVYQEGRAKQSEDHRATVTKFVLVLFPALQGFIVQQDFRMFSLPLAVFIFFLGIYGAVSSAKLYERARLAYRRVRYAQRKLAVLCPDTNLAGIHKEGETKNEQRFRRLSKHRLSVLWFWIHSGVAAAGVLNVVIIGRKYIFTIIPMLPIWLRDALLVFSILGLIVVGAVAIWVVLCLPLLLELWSKDKTNTSDE